MASLTPPPVAPQRGDRTTFASRVDAFITWLINFVNELTALVAGISALVAGGANKIPFKVDLGTTMSDPTAGWLRLNSTTQNAATAMVTDVVGADSIDYTSLLNTFDDSTSTTSLGQLRIEKMGDASKFLVFGLTAMTSPAGYRQFTVSCIGYSTASPFAQGDQVVMSFQRTGDKGDVGASNYNVPLLHVREEYASGTAAPSVANNAARALNTVKTNTVTGASLASNQVTLPAGTYDADAVAPCVSNGTFRAQLYNVTDAAVQIYGSSEYNAGTNAAVGLRSRVIGRFTIAAAKVFELRHIGSTYSGGQAAGGTSPEVYAEATFTKVA